jgi:hypothetical protein
VKGSGTTGTCHRERRADRLRQCGLEFRYGGPSRQPVAAQYRDDRVDIVIVYVLPPIGQRVHTI